MTCESSVQLKCERRLTRIESQLEEVLRRINVNEKIEVRVRALEIWRALLVGGFALIALIPLLQKLIHLL